MSRKVETVEQEDKKGAKLNMVNAEEEKSINEGSESHAIETSKENQPAESKPKESKPGEVTNSQPQTVAQPAGQATAQAVGGASPDLKKDGERKEEAEVVPPNFVMNEAFQGNLITALEKYGRIRSKCIVDQEMNDDEINKKEREIKEEELYKEGKGQIVVQNDMADDQLSQLNLCKKAYLDQYYELSDLMVCCSLYRRYRLSLEFNEKAYHLYNVKEAPSGHCSHDCCPNQCRGFLIDFDYYTIKENIKVNDYITAKKLMRCGISCLCACCSRPTLEMRNQKGEMIGRVVELRTACTPTIMLYYKNNRNPTWKIAGRCSQCGYCCRDLCTGCCNEANFYIYKSMDEEEKEFGQITKRNEYGKVWKPDCERIEITFPESNLCHPEEKVLILGGTLLILYLYYQNSKVRTRCHNE